MLELKTRSSGPRPGPCGRGELVASDPMTGTHRKRAILLSLSVIVAGGPTGEPHRLRSRGTAPSNTRIDRQLLDPCYKTGDAQIHPSVKRPGRRRGSFRSDGLPGSKLRLAVCTASLHSVRVARHNRRGRKARTVAGPLPVLVSATQRPRLGSLESSVGVATTFSLRAYVLSLAFESATTAVPSPDARQGLESPKARGPREPSAATGKRVGRGSTTTSWRLPLGRQVTTA